MNRCDNSAVMGNCPALGSLEDNRITISVDQTPDAVACQSSNQPPKGKKSLESAAKKIMHPTKESTIAVEANFNLETNEDGESSIPYPTDERQGMTGHAHANRPHPALEVPIFYFILQRCPWLLVKMRYIYRQRSNAFFFLHRRLRCSPFFCWGCTHNRTVSDTLVISLLITLGLLAVLYSTLKPNGQKSGCAVAAIVCIGYVFAQKNSILTLLFGYSFEQNLSIHKLAGYVAYFGMASHVWLRYAIDSDTDQQTTKIRLIYPEIVAFVVMTLIILSSLPIIRRRYYKVFYILHVQLSIVFVVCATTLPIGRVAIPCVAIASWGLDLLIRSVVMTRMRYPRTANLKILNSAVIELSISKSKMVDNNPGQFFYISVPKLSRWEWHPFYVSSSPKMKTVTFHIRRGGRWTERLYELAKEQQDVSVLLEGPYGSTSVDLSGDRYQLVLLVSAGIGFAPVQSICDQLLFDHMKKRRKLERVRFVWTNNDPLILQSSTLARRSSITGCSNAAEATTFNNPSISDFFSDSNTSSLFSHLIAILPPGNATEEDYDEFYEQLDAVMELNPESLSSSSSCTATPRSIPYNPDINETTTSVGSFDPWKIEAVSTTRENPDEILDLQLFVTGDANGFVLLPNARTGHPNIRQIFVEMKQEAIGKKVKDVAVLVSGPRQLTDSCIRAAVAYSKDRKVIFDIHTFSTEW